MSKTAELDLTIQKIKQNISYIVVAMIIIIIAAFLVHAQMNIENQKLDNQIYDLKIQIKSLEETIDYYERREINESRYL